tara:strand:+ start:2663 stop:2815 length:153 start_codon:yes stop_codon:yes gene_type:complete
MCDKKVTKGSGKEYEMGDEKGMFHDDCHEKMTRVLEKLKDHSELPAPSNP